MLFSVICKSFRRKILFLPKMNGVSHDAPLGVQILQSLSCKLCPRLQINRLRWYQVSVLALTYVTYMTYHLTRKPISVVKSVLHRNCSELTPPPGVPPGDDSWCDWPPFNTNEANALLGALDSAFLFSYAAAMFISGMVAERVDLRYFLTLGMLSSAIFCYLFGVGYTAGIHNISYYLLVQAGAGIAQTTGWPGTVAIIGKWFRGKKGLIFGIWNSHTSLGNILGTLLAAKYVEIDWSLSFVYPALVMGVAALLVFLFLVPAPCNVGLQDSVSPPPSRQSRRSEDEESQSQVIVGDQSANLRPNRHSANTAPHEQDEVSETTSLLSRRGSASSPESAITLSRALKIPGVVEFSLSLFFAKLVSYTFLFWLPVYITSSKSAITLSRALKIPEVVEFSLLLFFAKLVSYTFLFWLPVYISSSTHLTPKQSGELSTVFDAGGAVGAIVAGLLADCTACPAVVCVVFYMLAAPGLLVYQMYGAWSYAINVTLLIVTGALVNGPYALITTAVSAELGTHSSLAGNSKALATVTAIIDGTGSIGAAVGPMLAGVVSATGSWAHVFAMLIACDILALLLLLRIVKLELKKLRQERRLASPRLVRIE